MNYKKLLGIASIVAFVAMMSMSCNRHLCDAYSSNHENETEKEDVLNEDIQPLNEKA